VVERPTGRPPCLDPKSHECCSHFVHNGHRGRRKIPRNHQIVEPASGFSSEKADRLHPFSGRLKKRWPGRHRATREGWRYAHVQAIIVAIDQYAEAALGNRQFFLNKPYGIGGSRKDNIP